MLQDVSKISASLAASLRGHPSIAAEELSAAESLASKVGVSLYRVLLDRGMMAEEDLLPILCRSLGVRYISNANESGAVPDKVALSRLTVPFSSSRAIVPIQSSSNGPVPVLMADPTDLALVEELEFLLDRVIEPRGALLRTIRTILSEDAGVEKTSEASTTLETGLGDDGPVIRFVNEKLSEAVALGGSDIHFEDGASGLTVRTRINGQLTPLTTDSSIMPPSVFARLKVMAKANVAERRLPQDARFSGVFSGRKIDFRMSSLPTQFGESVAIRVLDPNALRLGWKELGFTEGVVSRVTGMIEKPSGLFLVTGPTGSGKTTTLYTALAHLNTRRRKVISVEDPIEYSLPGVQQVQVQQEIGLTFARVLRSILRHDPNVVMIGEIRDSETAEIACRAAQIGRMVLSTVHTRSASAAKTRLVDLGVPKYIVDDVLRGVLGQNLALNDCAECQGRGCLTCQFSGSAVRELELDLVEFS